MIAAMHMSKPENDKNKPEKIVIQGKTGEGRHFRPSDWAERMSGSLATFKNQRILYSPLLRPKVNNDGYKCIVLDAELAQSNPALYHSILSFAEDNNLTIFNDKNDQENEEN